LQIFFKISVCVSFTVFPHNIKMISPLLSGVIPRQFRSYCFILKIETVAEESPMKEAIAQLARTDILMTTTRGGDPKFSEG